MPRVVRRSASLPARSDGTLRLAVVADTHSAPHPEALARLVAARPDAILHAGDIGALDVLDRLATVAPVFAVRGNIDEHAPDLPDRLVLDVHAAGGDGDAQGVGERGSPRPLLLRILLLHIAVNGPKLRADALREAQADDASLVVCGHSHVPFIGQDRGVAVFNPGSIGPRRFHLPIVFGTIDLTPREVKLAHVDCETGTAWRPGRA